MFRVFYLYASLSLGFIIFLFISCQQENHKKHLRPLHNSIISANDSVINEAGSKYVFIPKLKTGDSYYYTINNTSDINIELAEKKTKSSTVSTIGLLYQVIADTADKYTIKVTYKKLHTLNKKDDITEEMDADNNYSFNATEKLLSGLKDQSVYITLTKKGQLLSVNGYNEIAAHAISQVQIDDENKKKELQSQLSSMLGESFIKSNVTQGENLFSVHAIAEGDVWTKNFTETIPFPISGVTNYKFENVDDDTIAEISASSNLTSTVSNTVTMGSEISTNLKGKSGTIYHLNVTTGMIVDERIKSKLSGTIQVMGRDVPIDVDIEKSITVKKYK